jgi:flavodoxin
MKARVIYDSFFGNTEQIAYSIRDALGSNVEPLRVGDVEPEQISGLGYLIVGSPTRAFKSTKAITTFLKKMPGGSLRGVKVAAFARANTSTNQLIKSCACKAVSSWFPLGRFIVIRRAPVNICAHIY